MLVLHHSIWKLLYKCQCLHMQHAMLRCVSRPYFALLNPEYKQSVLSYSSLWWDSLESCLSCFLCLWWCCGLSRGRNFLCMWWTCFFLLCLTVALISCSLASSPFTTNLCFAPFSSFISARTWFASEADKYKNN